MAQTEEIKVSLDSFSMEEMVAYMTGQQTTAEYFAFLERAVVGGIKKLPFSALPRVKEEVRKEIQRVAKGQDEETPQGNS